MTTGLRSPYRAFRIPRGGRGFTLIELLAVIAILGLLMGILLPSLSAARRSAKASVCLSHLKGIGNNFALYLNENEDKFPPGRLEHGTPTDQAFYINDAKRVAPRWQWFLNPSEGPVINTAPYAWRINTVGFFDDTTVARPGNQSGRIMTSELFTCPSLDDPAFASDIRDGAYGYNYQYLGNARSGKRPSRWDNFAVGQHQILSPSATVMVADSRGAGRKHGRHSYTLDPPRLAVERNATEFGPDALSETRLATEADVPEGLDPTLYAYSPAEARHKALVNVVFVDTHAESLSLTALGYQFSEEERIPEETPEAIRDPLTGSYSATNKLFNGEGNDTLANEHRPSGPN